MTIKYCLTECDTSDPLCNRVVIETENIESLMCIIADVAEDDICNHWLTEYDTSQLDAYGCGEQVLSESLDEWLYDFIGRKF